MNDTAINFMEMAERAFAERDKFAMALAKILKANDDFLAEMPSEWEGDPLQDAINEARYLVVASVVGEGKLP